MKRFLGFGLIVAFLGLVQPVAAADIKVMTQNQYLGADLTPLFATNNEAEFNAAAVTVLQQIAASKPAERIQALAAEIAKAGPALVGLQEVDLFKCADLALAVPAGQGCDDPSIRGAFFDHLEGTLNALNELNETYVAAAMVTNFQLTPGIPVSINGFPVLVGVEDRDVILARSGIDATHVDFTAFCSKPPSDQGCNYKDILPTLNTPFGPINVERGFVAVNATVDGKAYRFVNTHLEEKHQDTPAAPVQAAQAAELILVLQNTTPLDRSLIVVGDTNSSPVDPLIFGSIPTPYMQFIAADFSDAWTPRPEKVPGFTCCQKANLSNHNSVLNERIDMLFSLDPPAKVKQARVVGATVSDKTPPPGRGLWPSDHGAVTGELQFQ